MNEINQHCIDIISRDCQLAREELIGRGIYPSLPDALKFISMIEVKILDEFFNAKKFATACELIEKVRSAVSKPTLDEVEAELQAVIFEVKVSKWNPFKARRAARITGAVVATTAVVGGIVYCLRSRGAAQAALEAAKAVAESSATVAEAAVEVAVEAAK